VCVSTKYAHTTTLQVTDAHALQRRQGERLELCMGEDRAHDRVHKHTLLEEFSVSWFILQKVNESRLVLGGIQAHDILTGDTMHQFSRRTR
jgi:hypothetical protein